MEVFVTIMAFWGSVSASAFRADQAVANVHERDIFKSVGVGVIRSRGNARLAGNYVGDESHLLCCCLGCMLQEPPS